MAADYDIIIIESRLQIIRPIPIKPYKLSAMMSYINDPKGNRFKMITHGMTKKQAEFQPPITPS